MTSALMGVLRATIDALAALLMALRVALMGH
jgi:hypothetical protein